MPQPTNSHCTAFDPFPSNVTRQHKSLLNHAYDETIRGGSHNEMVVREEVEFLVKRDVPNMHNPLFKTMLERDHLGEAFRNADVLISRVKIVKVSFRVLHQSNDKDVDFNLSIGEVWHTKHTWKPKNFHLHSGNSTCTRGFHV